MTDERDPLLARAIDELRAIPPAEPSAIERVVRAAASARVSPADDGLLLGAPAPRRGAKWWVAASVAAAVVIAAVMLRGTMRERGAASTSGSVTIADLRPAAATAATTDAVPIAQQFVFNAPGSHSVSVVGDFNGWNPKSAPMARSSDGDLWSVTVRILPGRHTFGYMVDDSIFALDPRMPNARDPDLGTEGSVVIVGRP
ncbi:MAG TPA: hypothetical protein VH277_12665 [Gemmatimonadaceae bacterium]|jgi:hypothetical protein|nr:hypothetical protein [Gemmatimonadaceae bacterium]